MVSSPLWVCCAILLELATPAGACSLIVANFRVDNATLTAANRLNQRRGPDVTNRLDASGWMVVHNLLWMTGAKKLQPFVERPEGHGADSSPTRLAVFNGEIYNYQELFPGRTFASDGELLLPAYHRWGDDFGRMLNGEFAVVVLDLRAQRLLMLTDVFGTKPLWFGYAEGGRFAVATYRSVLLGLGFAASDVFMTDPNTLYSATFTELQSLASRQPRQPATLPQQTLRSKTARAPFLGPGAPWPFSRNFPVFEFSLAQHKETTVDWIAAFSNAVTRRTRGALFPMCLGLSGGYDSGAIHLALKLWTKKTYHVVSILGTEPPRLIQKRAALGAQDSFTLIDINRSTFERHKDWQAANIEPFQYIDPFPGGSSIFDDMASIGVSVVIEACKDRGAKVLLSGAGVDEIVSDYSYHGGYGPCAFLPHACCDGSASFCGVFPENLSSIFPWQNFYFGQMRNYLMKEEHVAGSHGFETRYPFLDRDLVQEYLSLSARLKNSDFKKPVRDLLNKHGYPFQERKMGWMPVNFGAPARTVWSGPRVALALACGALAIVAARFAWRRARRCKSTRLTT